MHANNANARAQLVPMKTPMQIDAVDNARADAQSVDPDLKCIFHY